MNDTDRTIELKPSGTRCHSNIKWSMVTICNDLGASSLAPNERDELFKAVIYTQSYLEGYDRPLFSLTYFTKMWLRFKLRVNNHPHLLAQVFAPSYTKKRESYVDMLVKLFPTLLHLLYRYATNVLGLSARTASLVALMNRKSRIDYPTCPIRKNLCFTNYHFWKFFKKFGGRLVRHTTKPRLTDEQKLERVVWAKDMKKLIEELGPKLHYCFIDEKWFYTTSRRKKLQILPQAEFETAEDSFIQIQRIRSRRFPTKVMYMGVVGVPNPSQGFDGKIYMECVCDEVACGRNSYNQNISDYYEVNHALKRCEWLENFQPYSRYKELMVLDALETIRDVYELDRDKEFVFSYKHYSSTGKTFKWIRLRADDGYLVKGKSIRTKKGILRDLKFTDLILHRNICRGDTLIRDVTCDSTYMLSHIYNIGKAIRSSYHWVDEKDPIYLIIDNAGGHGTNEAKATYVKTLKEKFNIDIRWQVPNSPELNMLDLGVWVAVQSEVESIHRSKVMKNDVLAKSIDEGFEKVNVTALDRIHSRWIKVLDLIIKGKGDNDLVEKYRGSKVVDLTAFDDEVEHVMINSKDSSEEECEDEEIEEEGYEIEDDFVIVEDD